MNNNTIKGKRITQEGSAFHFDFNYVFSALSAFLEFINSIFMKLGFIPTVGAKEGTG